MTTVRKVRNRAATEQALLDACGKLLLRDGPEGIGVNRVVTEAGVGKDLIYRYFGGLPGLIKTWLERDANWPTIDELTHVPADNFTELSVTEQIQTVCKNYIRALRNRPVTVRILASEFMSPSEINTVLEEAGDRVGRELYKSLHLAGSQTGEDVVDVSLIFTVVANYFCMRAVNNPTAFAMDLEDDASWVRIETVLNRLIERYLENHS